MAAIGVVEKALIEVLETTADDDPFENTNDAEVEGREVVELIVVENDGEVEALEVDVGGFEENDGDVVIVFVELEAPELIWYVVWTEERTESRELAIAIKSTQLSKSKLLAKR